MAIGSITPFRPTGTVSLSAGTSSAAVALAGGGDSVVVTNTSASLAYVRFGADPSVAGLERRYAGDGELAGDAVGEQPGELCRRGACFRQRHRAVHPRRRILRLMAFTDAEKTDIRRFCGYPAYGAAHRASRTGDSFRPTGCWNSA